MESTLVSVIVPTYNESRAKLLRTIESILKQTYQNLEVIIVDDGSDTPFAKLNDEILDSRVEWKSLEANGGLANARNQGLRLCSGEYISFLDAGDWWNPEKIEKQVEKFAESQSLGLVFTGVEFHPVGGESYNVFPTIVENWTKALLVSQPILGSGSGVMITRGLFNRTGFFDDEYELPEDRDYWLRASQNSMFSFVNMVLTNIELTPDSMSTDPKGKSVSYRNFIDKHSNLLKKEGLMAQAYCGYHAAIAHKYFMKNCFIPGCLESIRAVRYSFRTFVLYRLLLAFLSILPGVKYSNIIFWLRSKFHK